MIFVIVQVIKTISQVFILYGIIQGLILFFLLLGRKQLLLALFFISLSYLLFIFTIEINSWYKMFPKLIWTNVPVWFLPAPLLFLHVKNFAYQSGRILKKLDWSHFLPALIAIIYFTPFLIKTDSEKIKIFEDFYSSPNNFDYIQIIYFLQIVIYSVAGITYIKKKLKNLKQQLSDSEIIHLQIVNYLYYTITAYIFVSISISLTTKYFINTDWGYFSLAFFTLSLTILISTLLMLKYSNILLKPVLFFDANYSIPEKNKYKGSKLTNVEMKNIVAHLDTKLKETQIYQNPELKLADVSDITNVASHHISQSLNQYKDISFFFYINQFRVDKVKEEIKNNRHKTLTLLAIARECGFKSESSFYRIFKQITGETPGNYLKNISTKSTPK